MDEAALIASARAGRSAECAGERIPADVLRRICRDEAATVDARGLRLRDAVITDELELSGLRVPFPLCFDHCRFDTPLSLAGAELQALAITDSDLPGLLANGVRIRRELDLSASRITGAQPSNASTTRRAAVWLCESDIGGRVLCVDTAIDAGTERAIQADRMHVGGTVRFIHDFSARGEVRLLGVHIDGSLDLTGARLEQPAGLALDIADAVIGGSVHVIGSRSGRRPVVHGRIDAGTARIAGRLMLRDVELTCLDVATDDPYWHRRRPHTAFNAPRLHVGGQVTLEGACVIVGGVDLSFSDLGDVVVEQDCRLRAAGRTALDLTRAELRASLTLEPGVRIDGSLALPGAHTAGDLTLIGTTWREPADGRTIAAQRAHIDGNVDLERADTEDGQLRFRGAVVGGTFDATGARLNNPAGETLNLNQATVGGSVRLTDGFTSTGCVAFHQATVQGRLELRDGRFTCPGPSEYNPAGHAIAATSAAVRNGMYLAWASITPSVDFTGTTTTILHDDPDAWPERFAISGFTYERFAPVDQESTWDWQRRCAWLERQTVFDVGPYEQVAKVLRQHGHASEAEYVLIAQRNRAEKVPSPRAPGLGRAAVRWLLPFVSRRFGYGYRPWRAVWLLVCLFLLVLVTVSVPPLRDSLRASDAQGDVYAPNGILVTTTDARAAGATDFARRASVPVRSDACGDGQVRCFDPFFFAADTVVPLVSLEQRATWYADFRAPWGRFMDVWLNLATIVGWLLSSVFVLSFTRFVRNK
jgi:hypothetical protein